jgi:predicted porin
VAWFNDEIEVQDDASYIGLSFSTRGPTKFFATTEWGVSLVRGGQVFNAVGTTAGGGFPTLENPQAGQVFGYRLGNVGVDFGPFGRIAVGTQWAVHTDVTLYTTDQFVVFGSQASATYTAGTDGGFLGTGRADQTVTYHGTIFNVLRLGGQLQFRTADNSETFDGAGLSLQLTVLPGVRLGVAYTKSFFDDEPTDGLPTCTHPAALVFDA